MLLRTASHGIAPAITLDFLIPRTILHQTLSRGEIINPLRTFHRRHQSNQASSLRLPSSLNRSNTTSGLSQLTQELDVFDEQSLAGLTHAQIDAYNNIMPKLRAALNYNDVGKIRKLWAMLKSSNSLAFFGHHHHEMCARGVANFCKRTPPRQLGEDIELVLCEMALHSAAVGATEGLKALMLCAIKDKRPDDALALYGEYLGKLREKGVLRGDDPEGSQQGSPVGLAEEDEPASLSPIRDEVLLCAIVAHAQRDSFYDALQLYLKADTRIAQSTVEEFTHLLHFDRALSVKMNLYARRLSTASLLARPPTLMKHLSNLTRDSATTSLEKLYSATVAGAGEPDPWLAITPEQLSETRVVLLPDFFWPSFIKSFLACRKTDLVERIWDDMLQLGVKPGVAAWNALLDGYGHIRMLNSTLEVWELMRKQGVKPDALSHRALISAYFIAGKVDDALARFQAFERDSLKRGSSMDNSGVLSVYNTTLNGLLMASRVDDALEIKKRMETSGPKPDIITYNTFLRYYGRKGELKSMAKILQELEPAGVKADVYTFSTLLASMLRVRVDADKIVVNFMKKQGVEPDTTALTAIIDNQLQERTPQGFKVAMDLLSKMERGDYGDATPNAITYTSVLTAINRGDWLGKQIVEEYSQRLWETMRKRGIQPTRTTYNVLLRASLENKEPEGLENALRYYRDMINSRVHMGTDTWYIMLKGLVDKRRWEEAKVVVEDMRKYKVNKISSSLRTLMDRVSRQNRSRGPQTEAYL
ncbi:hypothetical protein ONZ51_g5033 [Trametes cubensis]|uniref:Pentatricopeptide repeat-containing protein n=1 Tax=Trametes cubensis TaxID=1111947 RepID=A0AAD7TX61_9APHY|nr:hypothetical protein ONZ51_g5033 [Trametes cubensis]